MGKFVDIENDLWSVFNSIKTQELLTIEPSNFVRKNGISTEFVRVSIIASNPGVNKNSVAGTLKIEIYTVLGKGPARYHIIADILDSYLLNKTIGKLQFYGSNLLPYGADKDNEKLHKAVFTINFNYFGV